MKVQSRDPGAVEPAVGAKAGVLRAEQHRFTNGTLTPAVIQSLSRVGVAKGCG